MGDDKQQAAREAMQAVAAELPALLNDAQNEQRMRTGAQLCIADGLERIAAALTMMAMLQARKQGLRSDTARGFYDAALDTVRED